MFIINCYSVFLTEDQFINLSQDEIKSLCSFEYAIEVPREVFFTIEIKKVRYGPMKEDKGIKAYYFTRKVEVQ